jgi:hypothetical protein
MRTSFHHQPEAQHPNFQLSTSWQADYPIFSPIAFEFRQLRESTRCARRRHYRIPGQAAVATWTARRSEPELASDAKQTAKPRSSRMLSAFMHGNVWQWAHVRWLLATNSGGRCRARPSHHRLARPGHRRFQRRWQQRRSLASGRQRPDLCLGDEWPTGSSGGRCRVRPSHHRLARPGVGDFNGDFNSDLLWRQDGSGQVYVWEMNGEQVQAEGAVAHAPVTNDWHIFSDQHFII